MSSWRDILFRRLCLKSHVWERTRLQKGSGHEQKVQQELESRCHSLARWQDEVGWPFTSFDATGPGNLPPSTATVWVCALITRQVSACTRLPLLLATSPAGWVTTSLFLEDYFTVHSSADLEGSCTLGWQSPSSTQLFIHSTVLSQAVLSNERWGDEQTGVPSYGACIPGWGDRVGTSSDNTCSGETWSRVRAGAEGLLLYDSMH